MPDIDICPECQNETYEAECDNINCIYCSSLFNYCDHCGWTDHPECTEEE
jgi:hypothetical protein